MLTLNVNDTVTRVRRAADLETSDESKSVVVDAEILEHLNDAYRELWDMAAELAPGLVTTSATVSSPYALPSDYYQPRYIDYTVGGHVRTLNPYDEQLRNHYQYASEDYPRWRISVVDDVIRFQPSSFSADVTLYYVPTAPILTAGGTYNAWWGWDQYLYYYALRCARDKQEYDLTSAEDGVARAEKRIRRALLRAANPPSAIADLETLPDSSYYGS